MPRCSPSALMPSSPFWSGRHPLVHPPFYPSPRARLRESMELCQASSRSAGRLSLIWRLCLPRAPSCGSFTPIALPLIRASCLRVLPGSLLENKAGSRAGSQSWSWLSFIKHSESTSFSVGYYFKIGDRGSLVAQAGPELTLAQDDLELGEVLPQPPHRGHSPVLPGLAFCNCMHY